MINVKLLPSFLVISLSLMAALSLEDIAKADSSKDGNKDAKGSDKTELLKQEKDKDQGKNKDKKKDVPEPLTIVGSSLAVGFGVLFKKEYAKKRKQVKA